MHRDNKEDIHIDYKQISVSSDIDLLILGGGRAAEIKAESFIKQGINPDIYAEIIESLYIKREISEGRIVVLNRFILDDLKNYHVVVIATDDGDFNDTVREECMEQKKIFLYAPDYRLGNLKIPVQVSTKSMDISVNTRGVSPRTSVFLASKLREYAEQFDEFTEYCSRMRKLFGNDSRKYEIMRFINTEDFYFFFENGKADLIIRLFYGDDLDEDNSGD